MKKFLALFAATLMLLAVFTGCKSKETSAAASSGAAKAGDTPAAQANIDVSKASDDDCFVWEGTEIRDITDKGKKQETLIVPKRATKVIGSAFSKDETLKSIAFQNPDTKLEQATMGHCTSLTTVVLPKNLTEISVGLLNYCSSLKKIEIPETVTKISSLAFEGCAALESITIPKNVKELGELAFGKCTSLKSVTLPGSITVIDKFTFQECTGLTAFVVPDGVTEIRDDAFSGDENIKSITVPASVTKIDKSAFSTNADADKPTIIKVKKGSYVDNEFDDLTDMAGCNCTKEYY